MSNTVHLYTVHKGIQWKLKVQANVHNSHVQAASDAFAMKKM